MDMKKAKALEIELTDALRETDNKTLHVVADLNDMFSERIDDLRKLYKIKADAGVDCPSPAEYLLGFVLFTLSQYEQQADTLYKHRDTESIKEILHELVEIGATSFLIGLVKKAGAFDKFADRIRELKK